LIARKGEAAPISSITQPPEPTGKADLIAVTVRLDPERYQRLKMHGAKNRLTNQDILVAAIDAHFDALT